MNRGRNGRLPSAYKLFLWAEELLKDFYLCGERFLPETYRRKDYVEPTVSQNEDIIFLMIDVK